MNRFETFYAKHLSRLTEHVLSLLVVFLMLLAGTLWTGQLFGHAFGEESTATVGTANASLAMPDEPQLKQLGLQPQEVKLTPRDSASWQVTGHNGADLGVVVSSAPYAPEVKGFAGPTPLFIYLDAGGHVAGLAACDNADTPDFFQRAFGHLHDQWNGLSAEQASQLQVDGVSGATFSSKAIVANVQQSMTAVAAQGQHTATAAPTIGWLRTAAVALVLLTGIVMSWKLRGRKTWRIVQQVLNVGVLGFWCGQFLSLSLLRGWISNGLDPLAYLPTLLVLGVALLMPFFRRKHHYCSWVCPYGSLQSLAATLPLPKIHCSPKVYRWMSRIRMGVFCLLMLLLWAGVGAKVLDHEPFTAFMVTTAPKDVLILAGAFVVASCFVPQLWCRCLCPMGMTLDLAEDTAITAQKSPTSSPKTSQS